MNKEELQLEGEEMSQPSHETMGQLSPEDAKAALGLSTRLTEDFLRSQAPQQPIEEEVEEESDKELEEEPEEEDDKMDEEKTRSIIKEELGAFKEELKDIISELADAEE